jgi:hypothetical protein
MSRSSFNIRLFDTRLFISAFLLFSFTAFAQSPDLSRGFTTQIHPLLNRYCTSCHDTETKKGELDLERFSSISPVWNDAELWKQVADQVSLGEMPPADKRQPSAAERQQLLAWIDGLLNEVAESRAGDPGPVLLRRLNNAEYTFTLRDLTGVKSLDPAKEFPADSAAGEGFMNTGSSLVMSPALLTKYLDAAKKVTEHVVLLPDGFRFSEKITRRDWSEEILAEIRALYARYTEQSGSDKVNLQGIVFDTNEGGRLPLKRYLEATIVERNRLNSAAANFDLVAHERSLSAKYLRSLWDLLNKSEASLLLSDLRTSWSAADPENATTAAGELATKIATYQTNLWKFSSVGHIGKRGGPNAWMEPVNPPAEKLQLTETNISREKLEAEFEEFRRWFPIALCYPKIVPVDEVVTLTLAHREDHHLVRLMLTPDETARLDRLWREYDFVTQNALLLVDVFEQLWQYATQDADPSVFEPMRKPIADRAAAFRKLSTDVEPRQLDALVEFAAKAYRRPLTSDEQHQFRALYQKLRADEIPHEEAFRHTLARVFVAPAFLYKLEQAPVGTNSAPVSNHELATRLSYFLWSSAPDADLLTAAAHGKLQDPKTLIQQTRRMLRDERASRMATEFAAAWLHLYDFESLDEKSPRHFPEFAELRDLMFQEAVAFSTDLIRTDRSVLNIFDADYTFLNEPLAQHYGIPAISGPEFRRVDGVKKHSRGGVLTMAATLAKQSGASRTSPILRGNWISEVIIGEKLPKPPAGIPPLPEDPSAETLTMRELVQKHTTDPRCANCHSRIDGYGFAMEAFDAIGRTRTTDGAKPIDTKSKLHDGTEVAGLEDLRAYLVTHRRDALLQQFCRKLLGYALGRATMLSDRPLIASMQRALEQNDFRFSAAIEEIVKSQQFREIRGRSQHTASSTH